MIPQLTPTPRTTLFAGAAAAAVYATMLLGPLATLEAISGAIPFDMRPFGYTPQDARLLLEGLGPEGRSVYLFRQLPLDLLYPALLAITLAGICGMVSDRRGQMVRIVMVAIWAGAVFDYAENAAITAMLLHGGSVPDWLVIIASGLTISKSVSTTIAILGTCALVIARLARSLRPAA